MNIDNLPRGFRREDTCLMCRSEMTLFEAFLDDERGVITRFKCNKCSSIFGLIYSDGWIEAFKKAEEAELKGEVEHKDVKHAEDDLCLDR